MDAAAPVREPDATAAGLPPIAPLHTVVADGVPLAWVESGAGEPLVLLHGLGDSGRTWRRVLPALARRFRVLALDLPGHGLSGRPDAAYTLDWYADVVAAWMKAIDLPRAHFCGHSFGGGVAQWMVLRHRARVDRLALVDAGGLGNDVTVLLRLAALPRLESLCTPAAMRLGTRLALRQDPFTFGRPEPGEVEEMARLNGLPGTGRTFARTVRAVIDPLGQFVQTCREASAVPDLPPVAIFWGDRDRILPVRQGRMALERFRGSTLSVYAGCGHFPHLAAPQRFATELAGFLQDGERAPARVLFACPNGPRSTGPDALPVGRCADCTWRDARSRVRGLIRSGA